MEDIFYEFSCGCKFKCVDNDDRPKDYDGLPKLDIDYQNIRLDCQLTWNLLGTGRTRGVFQLDSNLGRGYSKKLEPENLEHLAALGALLRPGCLQYIYEGKSMTDHFIERRHGREPITYPDSRMGQFLDETFGVLTYQEQMTAIAGELAGFDGKARNTLRKNVGKKLIDKLFAQREQFVDGCIKNGISKEAANQIFDNIEKAGRYSFNRSHSYGYGLISYITAYMKAHFPVHFFCSSLKFVKDEDKLRELMAETSLFGVNILPPSITNNLPKFNIKDGSIQYGWSEVKGVAKNDVNKLIEQVLETEKSLNKEAKDLSWYEFLTVVSPKVGKDVVNNLIMCGLLDNTGVSRKQQLYDYKHFLKLSNGEDKWVAQNWMNFSSLIDLLRGLVESESCTKKRKSVVAGLISALNNPGQSLLDTIDYICDAETELLGVAVSQNKTANKEHYANIKVADFLVGRGTRNMNFVLEVKQVDERTIKTGPNLGKNMANLKLADRSGEMECTLFSKEWSEFKLSFVKGNVILLVGSRHKDGSLRVENVEVL